VALRAVAVPAAMVLVTSVPTALAGNALPAKGWCAAYADSPYQLDGAPTRLVGTYIRFSMIPEQLP